MGKYDVTFSCGHKQTVQLYGKKKDRENKISWYENSALCPECFKKKREEELEEQRRAAFADEEAKGYIPLTGTEKQIRWAVTIRKNCMDSIIKYLEGCDFPGCDSAEVRLAIQKHVVESHPDSKFWIENRDEAFLYEDLIDNAVIAFGGPDKLIQTFRKEVQF